MKTILFQLIAFSTLFSSIYAQKPETVFKGEKGVYLMDTAFKYSFDGKLTESEHNFFNNAPNQTNSYTNSYYDGVSQTFMRDTLMYNEKGQKVRHEIERLSIDDEWKKQSYELYYYDNIGRIDSIAKYEYNLISELPLFVYGEKNIYDTETERLIQTTIYSGGDGTGSAIIPELHITYSNFVEGKSTPLRALALRWADNTTLDSYWTDYSITTYTYDNNNNKTSQFVELNDDTAYFNAIGAHFIDSKSEYAYNAQNQLTKQENYKPSFIDSVVNGETYFMSVLGDKPSTILVCAYDNVNGYRTVDSNYSIGYGSDDYSLWDYTSYHWKKIESVNNEEIYNDYASTVDFYFNPMDKSIRIHSEEPVKSIAVINISGQQVLNSRPNSRLENSEYNISTQGLKSGIYIVSVNLGNIIVNQKLYIHG